MNRIFYYILVLLVLLSALLWFLARDHDRTFDRGLTDFAVQETGRLERIIMEEGDKRLELKKKNGKWILNGIFETREEAVEQFLQTLQRIRVKSPSPVSLREELLAGFSNSSVKVLLCTGRRSKIFFVHEHDLSNEAYMMMENSDQPFAVDIYGYRGSVYNLFVVDEGYWRPNTLFSADPSDIAFVRVEFSGEPAHSFQLEPAGRNNFELTRLSSGEKIESLNDSIVAVFLSNFYFIPFQRYANEEERQKADSLRNARPEYKITLNAENGYFRDVKLFRVTLSADPQTGERQTDPFMLYGLVNNDEDMIIVRYTDVDLILRRADYFLRREDSP